MADKAKPSVNMIICFFFGERRRMTETNRNDRFFFLKKQVSNALNLKHNISKFTFVVNSSDPTCIPEEYKEIVAPMHNQSFEFESCVRFNIGLSYAAYSAVVEDCDNSFDYYIFCEDDFEFCEDNFDTTLIEKFNSVPDCSAVCAVGSDNTEFIRPYPCPWENECMAVSIWLTSNRTLERIKLLHGHHYLPASLPENEGYRATRKEEDEQVYQTEFFYKVGKVLDITDEYKVVFTDKRGDQVFSALNEKELIRQLD